MALPFQGVQGTLVEMDSLVHLEDKETLGLKATLALLALPDSRALEGLKVREDHQATLEDHWQALKVMMVSKAHLALKDQKKSSCFLQSFFHPKVTRETRVLLVDVDKRV